MILRDKFKFSKVDRFFILAYYQWQKQCAIAQWSFCPDYTFKRVFGINSNFAFWGVDFLLLRPAKNQTAHYNF